MTTTDAGLRIEYFKDNLYGRVYAVPSAHPQLDWTAAGGNPYLGYLIRFGKWTIYHAGDCVLYPDLAAQLRPFNVNVALLPIGGRSDSQRGSSTKRGYQAWVVPMHYGMFSDDRESDFVPHMLGHRPAQKFKVQAGKNGLFRKNSLHARRDYVTLIHCCRLIPPVSAGNQMPDPGKLDHGFQAACTRWRWIN
jgi:hypothetical protein